MKCALLVTGIALGWLLTFSAFAEQPHDVLARMIQKMRATADRIVIDGNDDDWRGLPEVTDARHLAGPDPSRDIVGMSIAPREKDFVVMIRTFGRPSSEPWAFYLLPDIVGDGTQDLQILCGGPGRILGRPMGGGKDVELVGAELAIKDVLELRVPYAALIPLLPADTAGAVSGKRARPWMRITAQSYVAQTNVFTRGLCTASYRLVEGGPLAEAAEPESPHPPITVELPVEGRWFLDQGAFSARSHPGIWAYDLVVTDATGDAAQTVAGSRNEDYFCWGRFVRATVAGRVTAVVDGNPDDTPKRGARGPANQVMIDVGDHAAVQYAHLMHGSIRVKVGDVVRVGDVELRYQEDPA